MSKRGRSQMFTKCTNKLAEVDTVTSERKYILWIGPDNVTFKRIQMICFLKTCQNTSLRLLDTTLCDTVLSVSATGRWFSPSTPVSLFLVCFCIYTVSGWVNGIYRFQLIGYQSCIHVRVLWWLYSLNNKTNLMWYSFVSECDRSVVFSVYSSFLHQ
jgi:hypothetical protein